ncbi:MAG TPA: acyl-CoA synthetase [Acidiphilium sp.]|nr:MAG: acyl-CoA synthetase [Acidiphilium sp. 21-60-14]OYV89600.1 MAG: acyl-CoA synthetase [Acidiphilium sp. 37-60-79]OZB39362.1 MAG: acyl-CoA synthetase [Acidiphilium sp. 34-60-192]HQT88752.1 acyl-CoA synthetase [Acidiphilium sp.]HQU24607.1 acyl-CoA synthetase [Acidiphilium sp.]
MTDFTNGLARRAANYQALTPLSFLGRTASIWPERVAVIHGAVRFTWQETAARCRRLASALAARGIGPGDVVAVMAPNVPALLEAHFGVPMAGAVLATLNVRLDAGTIAYSLRHGEVKLLLSDTEFAPVIRAALAELGDAAPVVVDIADAAVPGGTRLGAIEYEDLLASGDANFTPVLPVEEFSAISLNYTSGTTGRPKGVVYHHRGAYLNALGNAVTWDMGHHPVYLWTLPMFHCNGWCFPWTVTLLGGTHVCLRRVDAASIGAAVAAHGVTHLCGAPVVMGMMLNAPTAIRAQFADRGLRMMTAGAPPPAAVIEGMETLGIALSHVYGLTETYGPVTVCAWNEAWDERDPSERAALRARQGVTYPVQEALGVFDRETGAAVPADGVTMGEVRMRGNITMMGYLKDAAATEAAFASGWFASGDLGVIHPDGYVELKDRLKDIIISGGENISTIEVETVLYRHPAVLEAAVVAAPDPQWGEVPCAFVTLRPGMAASEAEIIEWCRERMARFKAPKQVLFGELPKTSTGKIQKFSLRERARDGRKTP